MKEQREYDYDSYVTFKRHNMSTNENLNPVIDKYSPLQNISSKIAPRQTESIKGITMEYKAKCPRKSFKHLNSLSFHKLGR